jgi:hypothetical protein
MNIAGANAKRFSNSKTKVVMVRLPRSNINPGTKAVAPIPAFLLSKKTRTAIHRFVFMPSSGIPSGA